MGRTLAIALMLLLPSSSIGAPESEPSPSIGAPESEPSPSIGAPESEPSPSAAPLTGDQVLRAAREVLASVRDKSMKVAMRVVDGSGNERTKVLHGYESHHQGARKVLWVFDSPLELQGTGFLAWQNEDEPDSLWVYFPGQRRIRRVPPSLRRERFQGSMFTYEDLVAVFFLDYQGKNSLTGTQACGNRRCFVVESDLGSGTFAYDRLRTWIDTETFVPSRVEFYGDGLQKVLRVTKTEAIAGIPTITEMEMSDPDGSVVTDVEMSEIEYNRDLSDGLFTIQHLSQIGK